MVNRYIETTWQGAICPACHEPDIEFEPISQTSSGTIIYQATCPACHRNLGAENIDKIAIWVE